MRGVIVGYGTMGRVHHRRLQALGAEVVAVVDPFPVSYTHLRAHET